MIPGIMASQTRVVAAAAGYPVIRTVIETTSAVSGHVTTITSVENSQIGDRLIALLAVNGNASVTPPSGWLLIAAGGLSSTIGLAAYYRDKTSDSASVTFTIAGGAVTASISLALSAGTFAAIAPSVSELSFGFTATTLDTPLATDAGGLAAQMVFSFGAHRAGSGSSLAVTGYPLASNQRAVIANAVAALMCTSNETTAASDPGPFTLSVAANNRGVTFMQRGA